MKTKTKKVILTILCVILGSIFLFSSYKVISKMREYARGRNVYGELAEQVVVIRDENSGSKTPVTGDSAANSDSEAEHAPISVDFGKLAEQNEDVVGWIYCEGTPISYPVLQSTDNAYYLRRMINREYNIVGSVFMDFRSAADLSSLNTIIYGHNMNDDSMFGTFTNYSDQAYYDEHPVIWYLTAERDYKLELVAGYVADANSGAVYTVDSDPEALTRHIENSVSRSDFVSDTDVSHADSIITLSTCSYEYSNARYVLIGVPHPVEKPS